MAHEPTPLQRRGTGDRLLDALLREMRGLIETALSRAGLSGLVHWSERRWDVVDLMATWSRGRENANVHAWITGSWPEYAIQFEGAVWEDDESSLRRRVRFLTGPVGRARVTEGGADQPTIEIPGRDTIVQGVVGLVEGLQKVILTSLAWEHALSPLPKGFTTQATDHP